MASFRETLGLRLAERRSASLYRTRRVHDTPQQPLLQVDGRTLLSFCSNDYLGLANHPEVLRSFHAALDRYGAGSGASHLVSGHSLPHHALEEELAAFTGRSRALVFSSGYMANLGTLTALFGKSDAVFEDRLNHASLLDGGLYSGARFRRYVHGDVAALGKLLQDDTRGGLRCIVTDGVFSMDGDVAPLAELLRLAQQHAAVLMMDDAHGFGCLGKTGGGLAQVLAEQGVRVDEDNLHILVGTLGKAFGTAGAFVAGSEELIESLVQFCRPYIYTTALPPAVAAATRTSLQLLQREHWRREHLQVLVQRFRNGCLQLGFALTESATPIQGLLLGSAEAALQASRALEAQGLLVTAIRPPTVPPNTSRLRITFSAAHSEADVDRLLAALAQLPRGAAAALLPRTVIARSFGAAAQRYDAHAALQRQVATQLLGLLSQQCTPQAMLDLGCGTGYCAAALQQRWPQAALLALDIAEPMLKAAAQRVPTARLLCADAEALPLAAASLDLVVSSLAIQWCRDYARLFGELARVTRPGASVLLSTFGPASLREVRAAWAAVDGYTHVNTFESADSLAQHAQHAGFSCRVQRELIVEEVASLQAISRSLKNIGAHNMNRAQAKGLTPPRTLRRAAECFAAGASAPGRIPVTWEVFYLVLERCHEANPA